MDYTKHIDPHFETIGKRRKLTGYIGEIRDGAIVLHSAHYDNYSQAENALDAIVHDLLTDLAERGLADAVPGAPMLMPEGDTLDADGMRLPLFDDIAHVIDMALGNAPAKNVIPELQRVRARLQAHPTLTRSV